VLCDDFENQSMDTCARYKGCTVIALIEIHTELCYVTDPVDRAMTAKCPEGLYNNVRRHVDR
jgi:hypothetical protein